MFPLIGRYEERLDVAKGGRYIPLIVFCFLQLFFTCLFFVQLMRCHGMIDEKREERDG